MSSHCERKINSLSREQILALGEQLNTPTSEEEELRQEVDQTRAETIRGLDAFSNWVNESIERIEHAQRLGLYERPYDDTLGPTSFTRHKIAILTKLRRRKALGLSPYASDQQVIERINELQLRLIELHLQIESEK